MTNQQALGLVARLMAAYPAVQLAPASVQLFAQKLEALPFELGARVVDHASATYVRFPALAEILHTTAELAVGAPDLYAAWMQVGEVVSLRMHPKVRTCTACGGSGYADIDAEVHCGTCRGQGEVAERGPLLHPLAQAALQHVGGARAIATASEPGIIRAQWERAYKELLQRAHRQVQTTGDWQLPAVTTRALVAGVDEG